MAGVPIKCKLLLFFLPITILAVSLTGCFSYLVAVHQLRDNAYYLLRDTILQTNVIVNDKLTTAFEQLFAIENDAAFQNLMGLERGTEALPPGPHQKAVHYIALSQRFNEMYRNYFQMIDSIYLKFNNGSEFHLQRESVPRRVGISLAQWFEAYQTSPTGYYWLNSHRDTVFDTVNERMVISLFKQIGTSDSALQGIVLLNLKNDYFYNLLSNVKVSPNGYLALISPDGTLLSRESDTEYAIGPAGMDAIRQAAQNAGQSSLNLRSQSGRKMSILFNTLAINEWVLAAIVPEADLLEKAETIKVISLAVIVVLILVSAAVATVLAGSISNSIRYLSSQVRKVEAGDLTVTFDIKESNEIGILASGLAGLLSSVKNLLTQVRDEQEQKRKMELSALQSQINPHFLYNTLASIKHLIEMNENQKAGIMVNAITRFFMIGISKGKEVITVGEELEHVRHYLTIQKMRYGREFDYFLEIDETVLEGKIIKLTLQPIVENAIYHGLKNKGEPGVIRIAGYCQDLQIKLVISDDGVGIPTDRLRRLQQALETTESDADPITFGLKNVNRRLKLHFGPEYGLILESVVNQYTKVTISIPFIKSQGGYDV